MWRSLCAVGRMVQLAIIAFMLFVGVNVVAEIVHKPILADLPSAHAKK